MNLNLNLRIKNKIDGSNPIVGAALDLGEP